MHEDWDRRFCAAYSYGHNHCGLRSRRLAHFAHAYADICELLGHGLLISEFYEQWDAGDFYYASAAEHWVLAS